MNCNKSTENCDDEDFEIVIGSQAADQSPGLFETSSCSSVDDQNREIAVETDPYKTIEFIQREHSSLKGELLAQQEMLCKQLKAIESRKTSGEQKIGELNDRIGLLLCEIDEKDTRLINLEGSMKSYKEASEKTDEVCAQMFATEEKLKYYKDIVNGMSLENDGLSSRVDSHCVSVDANLAREILDNESRVQLLQRQLLETESCRVSLQEENLKLVEHNKAMANLITALQAQVEADQADFQDMKSAYERRVKSLTADLNAYLSKEAVSSDEISSENCSTLRDNIRTLTLNDAHKRSQSFECEKCKLRLPTPEIYQKHTSRCPSIVDSLF